MFRVISKENIQLLEHIEMHHSKTTDDLKQLVKVDMDTENGNAQVLIASAVGVGVNFKGVKYTVNCGCPRYMDIFVEQGSKAARAGEFVMLL